MSRAGAKALRQAGVRGILLGAWKVLRGRSLSSEERVAS